MVTNSAKANWWRFAIAAVSVVLLIRLTGKAAHNSLEDFKSKISGYSSLYGVTYSTLRTEKTGYGAAGDELETFCQRYRWKPFPDSLQRRKIYNLVLINDELEWLEIRLGQMYDDVDYFVILESPLTFTDTEKPLYVRESWDRFSKYHPKMLLHTLNLTGKTFGDAWARETFNRNAMFEQVFPGLRGDEAPNQGDVIIVGDVDELIRAPVFTALRNCAFPRRTRLHTSIYYYSFQWLSQGQGNGLWVHPDVTYFNGFEDTILPQSLRDDASETEVWNAGWHCSFCFPSLEEIVRKVKSFSHTEMVRPEILDPEAILERVRMGLDMFGRDGSDCHRVDGNDDVPQFLLKNKERYAYALNRDPVHANFVDFEELVGHSEWDELQERRR